MRICIFIQLFLPAIILSVFISCEQQQNNPVTLYGDSLVASLNKGRTAAEEANLDAVRKTVQAYRAANGRYPSSLDEIKDMLGSNLDLSKYDYNPETGAVSLKN